MVETKKVLNSIRIKFEVKHFVKRNCLFVQLGTDSVVIMLDAFHFYEKENVFSGGKSNGTDLFNGNFSEDLEHLQRQSSFLIFTEMTEKLLFYLLFCTIAP